MDVRCPGSDDILRIYNHTQGDKRCHQLVAITKELTEMLRNNRTVDWQKKETARAKMRSMVKRLLKKYKYPPEGQEEALETVISQCEMWTDNSILSVE